MTFLCILIWLTCGKGQRKPTHFWKKGEMVHFEKLGFYCYKCQASTYIETSEHFTDPSEKSQSQRWSYTWATRALPSSFSFSSWFLNVVICAAVLIYYWGRTLAMKMDACRSSVVLEFHILWYYSWVPHTVVLHLDSMLWSNALGRGWGGRKAYMYPI